MQEDKALQVKRQQENMKTKHDCGSTLAQVKGLAYLAYEKCGTTAI